MLTQESVVDIHVLHRQGMSIRAIARKLHLSRNTVRQYLRNQARTPQYQRTVSKPSLLEPFKPYLHERMEAARPHWIPATVLWREIQAQGYRGGEGIVRNYLRPFKRKPEEAVIRFETAPGQQLQVDFTTIRRGSNPLKALWLPWVSAAPPMCVSASMNARKTGCMASRRHWFTLAGCRVSCCLTMPNA